jgi:hypothetical protein
MFDLAMNVPTGGLPVTGGTHQASEPVAPATAGAAPSTMH